MDSNNKIDSEKEYFEELKKFKSELKLIKKHKSDKTMIEILNEAEKIGLFSEDYINKWKKRLKEKIEPKK